MKFSDFSLSATPAGNVFIVGYGADGVANLRMTAGSLPISTATQTALDLKANTADLGTAASRDVGQAAGNVLELSAPGQVAIGTSTDWGQINLVSSGGSGIIRNDDGALSFQNFGGGEIGLPLGPGIFALTRDITAAAVGLAAPGTTGNVLTSNGTTWISSAPTGGSVAVGSITGLGTGVATALAIAAGASGGLVRTTDTATTSTAGVVPTLGAAITSTGAGAPTAAQLYEAWIGAQRYSIRIRANDTALLHTAATGAGVATSNGYGRSLTSGATTGVARHAWGNSAINNNGYVFHQISGKDFRVVPWANRVEITVRLQLFAWGAATSGYLYVFFGVGSQIGTALANRGIGIVIDNTRAIKALAHNGTSLTTGSSIGTAPTSSSAFETYRINSDGSGNVSVFRDGALLGSITGGPTADGAINQAGLHVEIGNGGQSATNTVLTGDMTISVAPTGF